jgi:pilus assembly protein CpaB
MRYARGLVLVFAFSCAAGAALLVHRAGRIAPSAVLAPAPKMIDILVAARPLGVGETVGAGEVRWQPWPALAIPDGSIRRNSGAEAGGALPFEPAPARALILAGEPIAPAKLIRPGDGSALAALVGAGLRAVSVPIREESAAGGFIQPGDRVDVLVTRRQAEGGASEPARGEILLRGVKVLAIGKTLQGKAGSARTATLELAPPQASLVTAAQAGGEIALALIGLTDDGEAAPQPPAALPVKDVRMLKYGRSANRSAQP